MDTGKIKQPYFDIKCEEQAKTVPFILRRTGILSAVFETMLTEEQSKVFHKLIDIQSETSAEEMGTAYKAGFRDGMALLNIK
ncbi:MAG: hypothetical protein K2H19_09565 [Ruminococcus sp.]|nr:hypothetical protein [Ruminococcus sp.]